MRKKVYHLATCTTCQRILKDLEIGDDFEMQNIKTEKMTSVQVDEMKDLSGSYESLFSRNAMKYRDWNLREKKLQEHDYRQYIIDEYTFLKRPVFLIGDKIFVGNSKTNVEAVAKELAKIKA